MGSGVLIVASIFVLLKMFEGLRWMMDYYLRECVWSMIGLGGCCRQSRSFAQSQTCFQERETEGRSSSCGACGRLVAVL